MTAPKGAYASAVSGSAGIEIGGSVGSGRAIGEDGGGVAVGVAKRGSEASVGVRGDPGLVANGVWSGVRIGERLRLGKASRFPVIRTLCNVWSAWYRINADGKRSVP